MAVDTAEKRFSMINLGTDDNAMLFEVDSAVDLDDRQHLLGCYSGIAFASPGGEVMFGRHLRFIPGIGIDVHAGRFA